MLGSCDLRGGAWAIGTGSQAQARVGLSKAFPGAALGLKHLREQHWDGKGSWEGTAEALSPPIGLLYRYEN